MPHEFCKREDHKLKSSWEGIKNVKCSTCGWLNQSNSQVKKEMAARRQARKDNEQSNAGSGQNNKGSSKKSKTGSGQSKGMGGNVLLSKRDLESLRYKTDEEIALEKSRLPERVSGIPLGTIPNVSKESPRVGKISNALSTSIAMNFHPDEDTRRALSNEFRPYIGGKPKPVYDKRFKRRKAIQKARQLLEQEN